MDIPYCAEILNDGKSECRGCKSRIDMGSLRLGSIVQADKFDGKICHWYHFTCFFDKQHPKSVNDIKNFELLPIEDQKKIQIKLSKSDKECKGKKRNAASNAEKKSSLNDFKIEYSKSNNSECRGCKYKILKNEVRICKKDYETEVGRKYGGENMFYHLFCFAQLRSELCYFKSAEHLPGFNSLKEDDQLEAKKNLPAINEEEIPEVKKVKTEIANDGFTEEELKLYTEQNNILSKFRDELKNLSKKKLIKLLEANNQAVTGGIVVVLDRLADAMTFGALLPCKVCKGGQLVFGNFGYKCCGYFTEWTRCNNLVKEPERKKFEVPPEFSKNYQFLNEYNYVARTRIVKNAPPSTEVKKEEEENGQPRVTREAPPLYNMEFVILGKPNRGKDELKKQINKLGGKVVTKICDTVMAVIASQDDVEKMEARMKTVQENRIDVVPEEFVDEAPQHSGKIPKLVANKSICNWGSDPATRLPPEPSTSKSKSGSMNRCRLSNKVKLTLKRGTVVDPDSSQKEAHVYTESGIKYTAVLSKIEIQTENKNSYYKLQLLESDKGSNYWVFLSWGRIGTNIGDNKLENFNNVDLAQKAFFKQYKEKTGNKWNSQDRFEKLPGYYYPIEIDYGSDLIKLIFDEKAMNKVVLEFELNTQKMPLGKLSKKQIQSAYDVLNELQTLINESDPEVLKFIDASNKFYTFVPHSFGVDAPPVLKDTETIKQKIVMLDSFMEMEIAYTVKASGSEHTDGFYTEIDVLSPESEEFKIIETYSKNTHGEPHNNFSLDIKNIHTIKRHGEDKRFEAFKKLHNHKLLWHDYKTTSLAEILTQGLRIAPPEAPVDDYMFGKGIYFADMVSKSANYYCTTPDNSTGLLLLCDVALGNMYERTQAEYVKKLPEDKHSTKGIGRIEPDPKSSKTLEGIEVPIGKGVASEKISSALPYNKYIVYDVAQVNVKYLLRVDFKNV